MPERYMASLDLADRRCLVVGGGPVALRKARDLLACGAQIRVVAPDIDPGFVGLADIEVRQRPYEAGDIDEVWLVIAATNDAEVNARVVADAEVCGVWATAADRSGGGALAGVARRSRGRLTVAVSSDGASPSLTRWLAEDLVSHVDDRIVALADHLHAHRYSDEADPISEAVHGGRVPEALDLLQGSAS